MTRQVQSRISGHTKSTTKAANGTLAVTVDEADRSTDHRRWRLLDDRGRQTWHYLETEEEVEKWPQSTADRYFLGLPLVGTIPPIHFPMSLTDMRPAYRVYQISLLLRHRWILQTTLFHSYHNSSYRRAIGAANMAGPCSFSLVWSSHGT